MGHARYVGRVGALAVALGIGAAVTNGPAWADGDDGSSSDTQSDTSSSSSSSPGSSGSSTAGAGVSTGSTAGPTGAATGPSDPAGAGDVSTGSDGEGSEEDDDAGDEDKATSASGEATGEELGPTENPLPTSEQPAPSPAAGPSPVERGAGGDMQRPAAPTAEMHTLSTVSADSIVARATAPAVDSDGTARDVSIAVDALHPSAEGATVAVGAADVSTASSVTAAPTEATTELSSLLALNPLLNGTPTGAPESPFAWAVFAAMRRQTDEDAGTEQRLLSVADTFATAELSATPTYELDASIPMGSGPTGLAVTPDGGHVYVADRFTKSVYVVDTGTRTIEATIPMGAGPNAVTLSPDGSRAYVGLHGVNQVAVIDTATNTVVKTIKVGPGATEIAVTPDGSRLYVTNTSGRTVSVVDTATDLEIARVSVGSSPMGVAVSPDGSKVYVANRYSNSVSVISTATNTLVGTVKVGSSPRSVVFTPDGTRAYVTSAGPNTVSVINTATNTVVATVGVGSDPIGVAVSPDGAFVYAANSNDTVSVIDTSTNTVLGSFAVDPKRETGVHYVAVGADGTVYVTDTRDKMLRVVTSTSPVAEMSAFRTLGVEGDAQPMALMTAAPANSAPTASPTASAPDTVTGKVTGSLNAVDPEASPLTYTVQSRSAGTAVNVAMGQNWLVTDEYSAVSVIDTNPASGTYNQEIARIVVADGAYDVSVDPDGSRAYVTHYDGRTVTVIDTATNTLIGTYRADESGGSFLFRAVVVGADGTVYVTDHADNALYASTVGDDITW